MSEKKLEDLRVLLVMALLVLVTGLFACQGTKGRNTSSTVAESSSGVKIKALDAANNPLRNSYREWDQWLIENLDNPAQVFSRDERPSDWITLTGRVSKDGILLPQLEATRLQNERKAQGIDDYFADYPLRVHVNGHIDMELFRRMGELQTSIRAAYYPRVPQWLADNPPVYSVLVPSGEVITQGPLGSGLQAQTASLEATADEGCCGGSKEHYWRYSPEGEPIESSNHGHWWFMYFDNIARDLPAEYQQALGQFNNSRRDGYVYFTDPDSGNILSVWDWDATPLEGTALPPRRSDLNFIHLTARQIQQMYKYQQNPIH